MSQDLPAANKWLASMLADVHVLIFVILSATVRADFHCSAFVHNSTKVFQSAFVPGWTFNEFPAKQIFERYRQP